MMAALPMPCGPSSTGCSPAARASSAMWPSAVVGAEGTKSAGCWVKGSVKRCQPGLWVRVEGGEAWDACVCVRPCARFGV